MMFFSREKVYKKLRFNQVQNIVYIRFFPERNQVLTILLYKNNC